MKKNSSNLDFWDEPLPADALRRLPRPGAAGRPLLLAPSRKSASRSRMQALAVARGLRRAGLR